MDAWMFITLSRKTTELTVGTWYADSWRSIGNNIWVTFFSKFSQDQKSCG